jgi:hypothetical protein
MLRTRLFSILAALVIAAAMAVPALAGGEPKNEPPFIGSVDAPPTVVVADGGSAFSWGDAAIGAAAGAGALFAIAAVAALARANRRNTAAA